ncbi:MAG: zinc-ribbon domain containing protein [Bdellovibrionales bacterium]|nr:zinc-ribbon domain containing protein [Bdellovibrionales bacterium]
MENNQVAFEDRTLSCKDCGNDFTFTVREQEFYAEKGFTNDPVRCKTCRESRKNRAGGGGGGRGRSFGGGGGGGGRSFGGRGGGNRPPRQLFDAVCTQCGVETQVPFQPTPGKSVLCRDCFRK